MQIVWVIAQIVKTIQHRVHCNRNTKYMFHHELVGPEEVGFQAVSATNRG